MEVFNLIRVIPLLIVRLLCSSLNLLSLYRGNREYTSPPNLTTCKDIATFVSWEDVSGHSLGKI